mmetsp:Transcript_38902/g.43394  ORF Transcript_38902/g.43394 Transcript_38902/m.43394 type:complete len:105 (+) Transcript_38902:741-1055(+)
MLRVRIRGLLDPIDYHRDGIILLYVPSMVSICCGLTSGASNRWNDSSFLAPAVIFCCLLFQENLLLLRLKLQRILIFCRPVFHCQTSQGHILQVNHNRYYYNRC